MTTKGVVPNNKIKITTPTDHISTSKEYFCFLVTYGAIKLGVPQTQFLCGSVESADTANPKSPNFTTKLSSNKIFGVLISLCITLDYFRYNTAKINWRV